MNVISIGAGKNQMPLIKRLVERGYNVIAFDKDINAPGKNISYKFNNISTWDYSKAIQWIDLLDLQIKGVLCFSYGKALISQQKIINYYNMNGKIDDKFINIMCDKSFQRRTLEGFKLSTLKEYNTYDDAILHQGEKNFIAKSKAGVSSNNIFSINNENYNYKILERTFKKDNYIVQEFLRGTEYRIISLIKNTKISFLSVLEVDNLKNTYFTGRLAPKAKFDKEIIYLLIKIVNKFKIIDSTLKIDIIKAKNRIEILEIDFGIGGDYFETVISPKCYNYNFIDNYINLMLGLPVEEKSDLSNKLYFDYIYNINTKNKVVTDYNKILNVANKNFVEFEIVKINEQGQKAPYPQSNMDAAFGIIHNRKDLSNYNINMLFNKYL